MIDEQQLQDWRVELAGQRLEGAFLTRSQAHAVTQLVNIVAAGVAAAASIKLEEIEEPEETGEEKIDYTLWKNADLIDELDGRGLDTKGNKAEMAERLAKDDSS